jgi:hypothetical protein
LKVFTFNLFTFSKINCNNLFLLHNLLNKKFHKGIIHIKDITNNDEVQLGKNKVASSIPTLSKVSDIGNKKLVINSKYLPAKN